MFKLYAILLESKMAKISSLFSFSHFNCRSLLTGFDHFSDFMETEMLDAIGISETWLSTKVSNQVLAIPGYKIIRKDRKSRGGGVALYIKNYFKHKVVDIPENGLVDSPLEFLWISIKLADQCICLGTLYRPPNNNVDRSLDCLENMLTFLIPKHDIVLFGGDLNIDMGFCNTASTSLLTLLNRYGLHQLISQPTRVTVASKTILDIIAGPINLPTVETHSLKMDEISDHNLVYAKFKIKTPKPPAFFKTYRNFNNFIIESFINDVIRVDWDYIYNINSVCDMVSYLNANILQIYDTHAPLKTIRITKAPAPWLTDNLKLLIKLKKAAFNKYKQSKSNIDWQEFKSRRNYVNQCIKTEKKAFLQYKFGQNPKEFWDTASRLNIRAQKTTHVDLNASELNSINSAFIDKVNNLQDGDVNYFKATYMNNKFQNISHQLTFESITANEVEILLHSIKSKAVGADAISLKMLTIIFPLISDHITFIINKCLQTSEFPKFWKESYIVPLPKCEEPKTFNDYRPISILPTISKILEKSVHKQLSSFISSNGILPATQSGFRPSHSTTSALLHITDEILKASDHNMITCLILLDFSSAFDTINHDILLLKLKYFGLADSAIKFIKSYLSGRSQCTISNGLKSNNVSTDRGVPQGSILGPLLFTIYTADLLNCLKHCKTHQYADDTQLYHSFDDADQYAAADAINYDLNMISEYSTKHGLHLNEKKTQLIVFGNGRTKIMSNKNFKIYLNNIPLTFSDTCRNLGLSIDNDLRFKSHINKLIQKAYGTLKHLYFFKDILSSEIKLKLCDSLILSSVAYCDTVYWPAILNKDKESLQKLQNSCLRFAFNIRKFEHISHVFRETSWLKMQERFMYHFNSLLFSLVQKQAPYYLYIKLIKHSDIHPHTTRYRDTLVIPLHNSALFERSFSYNAAKMFNSVPLDLKSSISLSSFKIKLKKYLLFYQG